MRKHLICVAWGCAPSVIYYVGGGENLFTRSPMTAFLLGVGLFTYVWALAYPGWED